MPTTTPQRLQLACPPAGYSALPLAGVRWLEHAGIGLFVCDDDSDRPHVLCSKSVKLPQERFDRLIQGGTLHAFVRTGELDRATRHLRAGLDAIIDEADVSPEERIALVQAAAMSDIESTFRLIQCDRYVSVARRLAKQIAGLALRHDLDAARLFQLLCHNEKKFSRVTNAAAYCAILAKRMGVVGAAELEEVTVGAMLYDIGDRFIPAEVLNKNGPLAPYEWKIVEQHPRTGYLNLLELDDVTEAQRLMAYQHHERMNGQGYPVRLTGEEIHPWAKMAAVVDVFDAATGSRPYRKALEVHEALDILQTNAGTLFDEEIVECWTMAMA